MNEWDCVPIKLDLPKQATGKIGPMNHSVLISGLDYFISGSVAQRFTTILP